MNQSEKREQSLIPLKDQESQVKLVQQNEEQIINIQPQNIKITAQNSNFSCLKFLQPLPDPILNWDDNHQEIKLYSDFLEFIEERFKNVKRNQSESKYYFKIVLQVFIYILNVLELIFTLNYKSYNDMKEGVFSDCYLLSVITCVLLHSATWMYTYKFRKIAKKNIIDEIAYYIFYMIMGVISYFKIAPFLCYFNRDERIKQFTFSEINKYLMLNGDDKFRNPSRLFKKREKNCVNMFRDLIFHRVALLSMMITMCLQTLPQIFIQGFYNTLNDRWNDGFNVIGFLLLIGNLIYYLIELQFIVFTTTYRQMQTELQFKLQKIKIKFIQETKQLLKSDQQYMGFVQSFYFHIDPSTFTSYQKKRCMVQIITFLTRYKKFKIIQIINVDLYDQVTLLYLKNCFKVIQVENISLLYKSRESLGLLEGIFGSNQFSNLKLELQIESSQQNQNQTNIDQLWMQDKTDLNAQTPTNRQILFIENKKINSGWQALQMNQIRPSNYQKISKDFEKFVLANQTPQNQLQSSQEIAIQAKEIIDKIKKRNLLEEKLGRFKFLITVYQFYENLNEMEKWQIIVQCIWSILNVGFQAISIVYISQDKDMFIVALIVLTTINPLLQVLSFGFFQNIALSNFTRDKKILSIIAFGLCNFIKIWDFVLFALYTNNQNYQDLIRRNISGQGYTKFKSYASKFEGSLPVSVFQHGTVQVDERKILYIKQQPFYQAVMWRTSVEEAINKIPQFYIYILALSSDSNEVTFLWFVSFLQQLKEGIFAVRDILEVVVKDYFIPALILSIVSADQFFQSMLYLSSISNQMLLEYPKSFQILSKVKEEYLRDKFTLKINFMNIDFKNYEGQKKEKILAQFRYVIASTQNILEIDQTQKLFYMGPEIEDFVNCLKVSPIYQLKLNFNLIQVDPQYIPHINSLVQLCPVNLQFLQISVETCEEIHLELNVNRLASLKSISYSYYQVMFQDQEIQKVQSIKEICIDERFLQLDNYNFEQLYFEIAGNLILTNCKQFFRRFTNLKFLKMSLNNKNISNQEFQFSDNLNSINNLETLDISFENIELKFQNFPFNRLKTLRLILKSCQFLKQDLKNILKNLNYENTKSVQMEIIDLKGQAFTQQEIKHIVKNLEDKRIDVSFKIDTK